MAWTITYRVSCPRAWTEADRSKLRAHVLKWSAKLSTRSEAYNLSELPAGPNWLGFTKPSPDSRAARDYSAIVRALRELERLFPPTEVLISDEFIVTTPTRPADIDLKQLAAEIRRQFAGEPRSREGRVEGPAAAFEQMESEIVGERPEHERLYRDYQLAAARPALERAKADFEVWKRAQAKKRT